MRVLWISCLLIGSITGVPVGKDYGLNSADTSVMWQPSSSEYRFSGGGVSSDPGSSSSLQTVPYPYSGASFSTGSDSYMSPGSGGYMSPGFYSSPSNIPQGEAFSSGITTLRDERYSPEVGYYWAGHYGAGHEVQPSGYDSSAAGGNYVSPQDESWSSGPSAGYGTTQDSSEPVFSDVSDLEPVYSLSSRSRYQRGRLVFAQSRYTPEAPAPPPMPAYRHVSKAAPQKTRPSKAQPKGGF